MTTVLASTSPAFSTSTVGEETIAIKGRRSSAGLETQDAANYVADMILELRNISKSAKLYKVMVPLEFAYYEAFNAANQVDIPAAELERLRALTGIGEALANAEGEPAMAKVG